MSTDMCRSCLGGNVRMLYIDNKLQEIYEKLTSTMLNTEDGRAVALCYICVSQLQRCSRFADMACESAMTLTHFLHNGIEVRPYNDTALHLSETHQLMVTDIRHITLIDDFIEEPSHVKIELIDVAVKEETVEDEDLTIMECNTNDHIKLNESTEKPIKKQINETKYSNRKNIYFCDECYKKCIKKSHLIRHLRTHTGEKPYSCNQCNKTFSLTGNLNKHMKIHTGDKPYACNICKKAFSDTSNLSQHMLIHNVDKPYACIACKKAFRTAGNLIQHIHTHTGEKIHKCNVCNNEYTRANGLKRHMVAHTGEKPFTCNICIKLFGRADLLKKHMLIHNGEKQSKR